MPLTADLGVCIVLDVRVLLSALVLRLIPLADEPVMFIIFEVSVLLADEVR